MKTHLFFVLIATLFISCKKEDNSNARLAQTSDQTEINKLRLNQIQTLGSHNSYHIRMDEKLFSFLTTINFILPEDYKVDGLDLGADDYIEKPFDVMELLSRVNSKFRRYEKKRVTETKHLKIDLDAHEVYKDNKKIQLTNCELEILEILANNEGKIVSRKDLGETDPNSRALDMHIKAIRKKINDDNQEIIESIYGVGYKIN